MTNSVDATTGSPIISPAKPDSTPNQFNFIENVAAGTLSGLSAIPFMQPPTYFKYRDQVLKKEGKDIIIRSLKDFVKLYGKNLRVWYRGVGVNAGSYAPIIAIQTSVFGRLSKKWDPLSSAAAAGVFSSFVVCPAEAVMIQQQKTGKGVWATTSSMYSSYGCASLFRAIVPTMIREGIFASAYLGVAPWIKRKLVDSGMNEWGSKLASGVSAGVFAAALTQTADTTKTQLQEELTLKLPTIEGIFQKSAISGFRWRSCIVVIAVTMMPPVQEYLYDKIELWKNEH